MTMQHCTADNSQESENSVKYAVVCYYDIIGYTCMNSLYVSYLHRLNYRQAAHNYGHFSLAHPWAARWDIQNYAHAPCPLPISQHLAVTELWYADMLLSSLSHSVSGTFFPYWHPTAEYLNCWLPTIGVTSVLMATGEGRGLCQSHEILTTMSSYCVPVWIPSIK